MHLCSFAEEQSAFFNSSEIKKYNFLFPTKAPYIHSFNMEILENEDTEYEYIYFKKPKPFCLKKGQHIKLVIKGGDKNFAKYMQKDLFLIGDIIHYLKLPAIAAIQFSKPRSYDDALIIHFQQKQFLNFNLLVDHYIAVAYTLYQIHNVLNHIESNLNYKFNIEDQSHLSRLSKFFIFEAEEMNPNYANLLELLLPYAVFLQKVNSYIDKLQSSRECLPLYFFNNNNKLKGLLAFKESAINVILGKENLEISFRKLLQDHPILNYCPLKNFLQEFIAGYQALQHQTQDTQTMALNV